jgi:hypothetical protein
MRLLLIPSGRIALSDAQCGACAGGGQGKTPVPAGGAPPGEIDAMVALTGQTVLG